MPGSDAGYSSDGSIDSMYGVYSEHKRNRASSFNFSTWSRRRSPSQSPLAVTAPVQSTSWGRSARRTLGARSPPRSAISELPGDILPNIFTFYGENVFSEPGGHRFWWHTLALVCRKWNDIIRSSPNHFLDELRFGSNSSAQFLTNISHRGGYSIANRLRRWRLLPLHVHYDLITPSPSAGSDEDNVLVLLQHLERVYSLYIRAPLSTWRSIAAAASDPPISCTSMERIHLDTGDRTTGLVLPNTFLGGYSPRLREFTMIGLFPPSLPLLLLSPVHLTSFVLDGIPDSSYLPPEALLSHLGAMPQLQYLNVGFLSSIPSHLCSRGKTVAPGPLRRVVLSHLGQFYFRGVCAYLEALVTRLDTPCVYDICLTFFHQLSYALPRLSAFLSRTKRFGFNGVRINLYPQGAIISATPVISRPSGETFFIRIPCDHLDFQVASVAHVCGSLKPNFANMEGLFIKYHQSQLPVEWSGGVEPALWSEVLTQFHDVKTFWISSALVSEVTQAIRSGGEQLLEKMPMLAWIIVEVYRDDASIAAGRLSDLLTEIKQSGGPVIHVYRLLSDEWNKRKRPQR